MTGSSGMGRIARQENGAVCGKLIADKEEAVFSW